MLTTFAAATIIAVVRKEGIGGRLRLLRGYAGISARALDRVAKTPRGLASMLESGQRTAGSPETVLKYARALGCSYEFLILGLGKPPAAQAVSSAIAVAESRGRRTRGKLA